MAGARARQSAILGFMAARLFVGWPQRCVGCVFGSTPLRGDGNAVLCVDLWAMNEEEKRVVAREIRHLYYFIRTLRRGLEDAPRRRYYRKIAVQKKRLHEAGVSMREVLDLLACCRSARCRMGACLEWLDVIFRTLVASLFRMPWRPLAEYALILFTQLNRYNSTPRRKLRVDVHVVREKRR